MYAEFDEQEVLSCEPIELVCLLYGKALEKISLARTLTAPDRIADRNQAIARASQVVIELQGSLVAETGGQIAIDLERIYEYVQQRLAAGLAERTDEPLAEAAALLETLAEGWRNASAQSRGPKDVPSEVDEPELVAAGGRSWTV